MQLTDTIKRAPRWAWVTAAGIGLGAAGIKLWNNRDAPASEAEAALIEDPTSPYPTLVPQSGNPGIIVPPVIVQGNSADDNAGVPALQDAYLGALGGLMGAYQDVWGPVQTAATHLLLGNAQALQDLALAGTPPNYGGATALPAAIVPYPPPAPVAPIALPTPAPARKPCGGCPSSYPNCNEAKNKCYKVACASGNGDRAKGRWHLYATPADDARVSSTC